MNMPSKTGVTMSSKQLLWVCLMLIAGIIKGELESTTCRNDFDTVLGDQLLANNSTVSVAFTQCQDTHGKKRTYLAQGNNGQINGQPSYIYELNCGTGLTQIFQTDSTFNSAHDTFSVAFTQCTDQYGQERTYFAQGNYNNQRSYLYELDCSTGILTNIPQTDPTFNTLYNTNSITFTQCIDQNGHEKTYLAQGNDLQYSHIYELNCSTGILTNIPQTDATFNTAANNTSSLVFKQCNDQYGQTKTYLLQSNYGALQYSYLYELECSTGLLTNIPQTDAIFTAISRPSYAAAFTQCLDQYGQTKTYLVQGSYGAPSSLYEFDCSTGKLTHIPQTDATFNTTYNTNSIVLTQCVDQHGHTRSYLVQGNNGQPSHLYELECDGTIQIIAQIDQTFAGIHITFGVDCTQCIDQYGHEIIYIAQGNAFQASYIYELDCDTGQLTQKAKTDTTFTTASTTTSVTLTSCKGLYGQIKTYLAQGNNGQPSSFYELDCSTGQLAQITQTDPTFTTSHTTNSVAFAQCTDAYEQEKTYLLQGNNGQSYLYELNCSTGKLTQIAQTDPIFTTGHNTNSVTFIPCTNHYGQEKIYLAQGNNGQSYLYELNRSTGKLTQIAQPDTTFAASYNTKSVTFTQCTDHYGQEKIYLLQGNYGQPSYLYEFNCSTEQLTHVTQTDATFIAAHATNSVDFTQCTDDYGQQKTYLAQGNNGQSYIYELNCSTGQLTQISQTDPTFTTAYNTTSVAFTHYIDLYNQEKISLAQGNYGKPSFMYDLDCNGSLSQQQASNLELSNFDTISVAWYVCTDGTLVLAHGNDGISRIFISTCTQARMSSDEQSYSTPYEYSPTEETSYGYSPSETSCWCNVLTTLSDSSSSSLSLAQSLYLNATQEQRSCLCSLNPLFSARLIASLADQLSPILPACLCDSSLINLITNIILLLPSQDITSQLIDQIAREQSTCCSLLLPQILTNLVEARVSTETLMTMITTLQNAVSTSYCPDVICTWFITMLKNPHIDASLVLASLIAQPYATDTISFIMNTLCNCQTTDMSSLITEALAALTMLYPNASLPKFT